MIITWHLAHFYETQYAKKKHPIGRACSLKCFILHTRAGDILFTAPDSNKCCGVVLTKAFAALAPHGTDICYIDAWNVATAMLSTKESNGRAYTYTSSNQRSEYNLARLILADLYFLTVTVCCSRRRARKETQHCLRRCTKCCSPQTGPRLSAPRTQPSKAAPRSTLRW